MKMESGTNLHIFFIIGLALSSIFVLFSVSAFQMNEGYMRATTSSRIVFPVAISTTPDIIYSIQNNSATINFSRGFLITIMPVRGGDFSQLTLITIPTNLTEGSRVTVSIVEKNGNIKKLLISRVIKRKITFYTKKSGTFQIMKIGN